MIRSIPSQLSDGFRNYNNPTDIANGFNDFFLNIGPSLAKDIASTRKYTFNTSDKIYSCLNVLDPPTPNEVLEILHTRDAAPGHDEIRAGLIKKVASFIIEPLTHVLSLSLKTGVVPRDLKLAKVTPLYKSGDSSLFNNYRPISVLPLFSKVLEKLVYKRLSKHLTANCILYNHQYGFRENMSTEMALLQFVDKISKDLDNKKKHY